MDWHDIVAIAAWVGPLKEGESYDGLQDLVEQAQEVARALSVFDGVGALFVGLARGTWFVDERAVAREVAADVLDLDPAAPELVALADRAFEGKVTARRAATVLRDLAESE